MWFSLTILPPASRKTEETFQSQSEGLRDRGSLAYTFKSDDPILNALVSEGTRLRKGRQGWECRAHRKPWGVIFKPWNKNKASKQNTKDRMCLPVCFCSTWCLTILNWTMLSHTRGVAILLHPLMQVLSENTLRDNEKQHFSRSLGISLPSQVDTEN